MSEKQYELLIGITLIKKGTLKEIADINSKIEEFFDSNNLTEVKDAIELRKYDPNPIK